VLLARVFGLLVALAIGGCMLMYFVRGERRYLHFAWLIFKYALYLSVVVLLLIFGERLVTQF
jgi:hypothetical protein